MAVTDQFDTPMILSLTVWGEARGEGSEGQQAVFNVIMNRVKSGTTWWGSDPRSVCLHPYQFSCWNNNDPNLPQMIKVGESGVLDPNFDQIQTLAQMALEDNLPDITYGATSYYDKRMTSPPSWAEGKTPCKDIGHHLFFRV